MQSLQLDDNINFAVNIWMGIVGNHLIRPFFLPSKLNRESCKLFLQQNLNLLLEDVSLLTRKNTWFMHDAASPHFSNQYKKLLNFQIR